MELLATTRIWFARACESQTYGGSWTGSQRSGPDLMASNGVDRDAPYVRWRGGQLPLGDPEGEVYLVRDEPMRALQEEQGYALTADRTGPLAADPRSRIAPKGALQYRQRDCACGW